MGNAKMPNDFNKADETDDLIAELARLMANDARETTQLASTDKSDDSLSSEVLKGSDQQLIDSNPASAGMTKVLDSVLSASERLSVTREAQEVVQEESKNEALSQQEVTLNIDNNESQTLQSDKVQNKEPQIERLRSNDPIADLISAQLEIEELENLTNQRATVANSEAGSESEAAVESDVAVKINDDMQVTSSPSNEMEDEFATIPNNRDNSSSEIDPLIEIENLIGEAVRSGANATSGEGANSQTDSLIEEEVHSVNEAAIAAESAILSASNESQIPETVAPVSEHPPVARQKENSFLRTFLGPSIAGIALLTIGFGGYYLYMNNASTSEEVPVLVADSTPEKAVPEQTDSQSLDEQSVVMNELSGDKQPTQDEQIVSRDESQNNKPTPRIIETSDSSPTGIVNRQVRTVTVRPDGTIVSGDSARAGNEALPVERPNVPALPADSTNAAAQLINQPVVSQGTTQVANMPVTTPVTQSPEAETSVPVPQETPTRPAPTTPIVTTTPAASSNAQAVDLLANSANNQTSPQIRISPVATIPVSAPSTTLTKAPAYVQISSQRLEQTAQKSLIELQTRFASILGGRSLEVQRVDLGDKGIYYRVRLPADSIANANQICNSLKQAGGDCFVRTD